MSQFQAWLTAQANAGRGGFDLPPIDRGLAYSEMFDVGSDVSGDTFKCELRASPVDDPTAIAALAEFTVTAGTFANDVTPLTFTLTEAEVEAIDAADSDLDGVVTLYWTLLHTPNGGTEYLSAAGSIQILGGVTDDE